MTKPVGRSETPWWDRGRHGDRRGRLLTRSAVRKALRGWFEKEGFLEVEPGALQVSPGNEAHLHAFATELVGTDLSRTPLYLHTSPEFAMKKLLAAGEERIYALVQVYRNREAGPLHANDFTMLEWYRAGRDYTAMMADCEELLAVVRATAGADWVSYRGVTADLRVEPEYLTVEEAFARHAGIDLDASLGDGAPDCEAFAAAALAAGIRVGEDYTWSDIFARVLTERIEPRLGVGRPTLLTNYPRSEAALARVSAIDDRIAERFELYICGVEVANGFSELTDPSEQRRRLEAEMALKQARYGERYPIDEDFLAALGAMPEAAGCALGFDRLVMLLTGADRVSDVMWTPL